MQWLQAIVWVAFQAYRRIDRLEPRKTCRTARSCPTGVPAEEMMRKKMQENLRGKKNSPIFAIANIRRAK
jgi:hypothetical protein